MNHLYKYLLGNPQIYYISVADNLFLQNLIFFVIIGLSKHSLDIYASLMVPPSASMPFEPHFKIDFKNCKKQMCLKSPVLFHSYILSSCFKMQERFFCKRLFTHFMLLALDKFCSRLAKTCFSFGGT